MKTKLTVLLPIVLLLGASCSQDRKKNPDTLSPVKNEKVVESIGGFTDGTWRIDSMETSQVLVDRYDKDSIVQLMNFRKNGAFSSEEKSAAWRQSGMIGQWNAEGDSLFVVSKGSPDTLRYQFEYRGPVLVLKTKFRMSTSPRKPLLDFTFYLSRYEEKRNKQVFGQGK